MTYCPESTLEHGHASGRLFLSIRRRQRFDNVGHVVPELVVLLSDQHDEACGLRVETAGHRGDGVLYNLLELRIRNGRGFGELVDGAAEIRRVLEANSFVTHV